MIGNLGILKIFFRGNCSFVRKVQNIQNKGAHIALIVNNEANVNPHTILMVDDGFGKNLTIPGVLISKEDGDIIKQFWKDNKNDAYLRDIKVAIKFEMV